ncbi:MAG: hypothetical protein KIT10_11720 [Flavobacteriales bacterium]|nr:hypothetical protein [Flavobacteriales bacterium]
MESTAVTPDNLIIHAQESRSQIKQIFVLDVKFRRVIERMEYTWAEVQWEDGLVPMIDCRDIFLYVNKEIQTVVRIERSIDDESDIDFIEESSQYEIRRGNGVSYTVFLLREHAGIVVNKIVVRNRDEARLTDEYWFASYGSGRYVSSFIRKKYKKNGEGEMYVPLFGSALQRLFLNGFDMKSSAISAVRFIEIIQPYRKATERDMKRYPYIRDSKVPDSLFERAMMELSKLSFKWPTRHSINGL